MFTPTVSFGILSSFSIFLFIKALRHLYFVYKLNVKWVEIVERVEC